MSRLEIALLGPPEIKIDGKPVKSDRRKAIALLAYLAVTGKPHARDHLAALLWPDYAQASAHAYLRRTLWELNQLLGKEWIDADRERAALIPAPDLWLDTTAFQEFIRAPQDRVAALQGAVDLYRGDFLAGFTVVDTAPFEDWQFEQAEHFRREFARALESLVGAYSQSGQRDTALLHARRWLSLDPLNESAHRTLMRLLAGMGDRTGAIRQYQTCVQILKAELSLAPQLATTELYEAILRGEAQVAVPDRAAPAAPSDRRAAVAVQDVTAETRPASRLPVIPTPFIGRRREVEQVKALLQIPTQRLVTLIGPGGTGKTRLAIQAASEVEHAFPDGVFFAALAPAQTAEAALPALAMALDFSFYHEEESHRQQLLDYMRDKQLLLILDNVEHLAEVSGLVAEILSHASGAKLMATSRVRLNVQGEQLFPVGGMRTPEPAETEAWDDPEEQAKPFSAVQLFLDRARRVRPGFALTRDNVRPVLEICKLVHGMPLGLELAAAWLELLPPAEIAFEMARSLDFLGTDQAGVPDRQRSLRAVFESSWKLLSEAEREAFQRLCVFVGSFSRAAAQQVSGASLRTLLGLADKAWLELAEDGRFQLHELMRQYGEERLKANADERQAANDRHAAFFAGFVSEQFQRMCGAQQLDGLLAIDEEFGTNIKAAWDWLVAGESWADLAETMAPGLFGYGLIRWRQADLISWLRPIRVRLASQVEADDRLAIAILGTLEVNCEEMAYVKDANPMERLAAIWQAVAEYDLAEAMGFWFVLLAGMVHSRNLDPDADKHLDTAVARMRDQDDRWMLGISLLIQSNWWKQYSLDEVKLQEAAQIFRELGVFFERGLVAELLGKHAAQQRRPSAEITRHFQQAMQFYAELGDQSPKTIGGSFLAGFYIQQGEIGQAFSLLHEEQRFLERIGNKRLLGLSLQWESLHAVRYSTFEHALETRQRSLELARKYAVQSVVAWQEFELGEIYRIFGRPEKALEIYEQAGASFEKMKVILGLGYCQRAQGDLALRETRYADALARYQTFLTYAQQDNHLWSIAQARAKLALAHACLEDQEQARLEMRQGLSEMQAWGEFDLALLTLLAEPICLIQDGKLTQAVELAAFIAHHPASWNEMKQQARATLETAARGLPEAVAQLAIQRGKGFELQAVIQRLLEN